MRYLLLIPAVMLGLASLHAAPPAPQERPARDTARPAEQKAPGQTRKQSPKPARSFTPSEKIGADSAVSFPVDI